MRVILAGQKSFGTAALRMLVAEGHEIAGVWCPEDDTKLRPAAERMGVFVPTIERNEVSVRQLEVDLFVAAHSHDFIGRASRAATRLGGIGYHPSLLPRHRGRDAVRWTVHLRDPIAGGSVYWLTDSVDGGPIAGQDWCFVDERWDASDLWRKALFPMGIRLLRETLSDLESGLIVEVPQDPRFSTWEPSWDRPPLHRPELPQIGPSPNGYRVKVTPDALRGFHRGVERG